MAVPANPTLLQVCAEFGAPAGTPLSAFVRGGVWVPNSPQNANVPTGLPIALSQLAGAVKSPGAILTSTSVAAAVVGSTANARYRISNDGNVYKLSPNIGTVLFETWLKYGNVADYWFYATMRYGTLTGGPINTFVSGSVVNEWHLSRGSLGLSEAGITVSVYTAGGGTFLDSADIELSAERDNPE